MKSCVLTMLAALYLIPIPAAADDGAAAQAFYDGAKIRWIVPYRPGGGYDQYTRLIAPYFEAYTGARVEIVNMPGAGGTKGAVETFRSPPDGLHIGILNGSALVANAIAGTEGADYDVTAFSYIGRISAEERVLVVSDLSGLRTLADIREAAAPVVIGATGQGGSSYLDSLLSAQALGYEQRLIAGFDSSADVRLALLRGDVAGMWGTVGSAADGITAGEFHAVLRTGTAPDPLLEGVPSVTEYAGEMDAGATALVAAWLALADVGRPLAGPPGIPEDRLAFLREALRAAMSDPEFVAQSGAVARELSYLPGEALLDEVRRALEVEGAAREALVAAITGAPGN
jgi:tripartite-type tricarboxylate transporter receptor subunit TctC